MSPHYLYLLRAEIGWPAAHDATEIRPVVQYIGVNEYDLFYSDANKLLCKRRASPAGAYESNFKITQALIAESGQRTDLAIIELFVALELAVYRVKYFHCTAAYALRSI